MPATWLLVGMLAACASPAPGRVRDAEPPPDAWRARPPLRDAGPPLCAHEGPLRPVVPIAGRDECVAGVVPMGFGLRWQRNAQRLAHWGMRLDFGAHPPEGCPAGATSRGATLEIQASGGQIVDEPEDAVAFFDYQTIAASSFGADAGAPALPRLARASTTIDLAEGAIEGEGVALVDLAAGALQSAADVALVLEGFDVTTDIAQSSAFPADWSPARGFASRGLGIAIVETSRDERTLRARVSARFEPGTMRRGIWEQPAGHDRAVAVARRRVVVRVLAIAADAPVVRARIGYRIAARQPAPLAYGAPCRAPAEVTSLVLDGADGFDRAVVGLARFDVRLWPDRAPLGDLLREISVRVRDLAYDPASGRASLRVDAYASNEGPFPQRAMDARFDVEVALAQWRGGGPVRTLSVAALAPVGRTEVGLPMQ